MEKHLYPSLGKLLECPSDEHVIHIPHQEDHSTPTKFLVTTCLISMKSNSLIIKTKIPSTEGSQLSINGSLQLIDPFDILWINEVLRLCQIHILEEASHPSVSSSHCKLL